MMQEIIHGVPKVTSMEEGEYYEHMLSGMRFVVVDWSERSSRWTTPETYRYQKYRIKVLKEGKFCPHNVLQHSTIGGIYVIELPCGLLRLITDPDEQAMCAMMRL